MTKHARIKAVKKVFSLVKNGVNITQARQTVAEELGLNAGSTIWNWQRQLKMTTPVVNTSITRVNNNVVARRNTSNVGISSMKNDLGTVFTSLVDQDGRFSNQDATAISGVANVILGSCKQVLLERKAMGKVNKTEHLI